MCENKELARRIISTAVSALSLSRLDWQWLSGPGECDAKRSEGSAPTQSTEYQTLRYLLSSFAAPAMKRFMDAECMSILALFL